MIKYELQTEINPDHLKQLKEIDEKEPEREDFSFGTICEPRDEYWQIEQYRVTLVENKR